MTLDGTVLAQFTQLSFSRLRRCASWRAGKPRTTSADLQNLRIKTPLNLQTLQLYPIVSRLSIQAQGRVAASGSETLWALDMLEACKHPTKKEGINIRNHQPSPKRVRLGYEWITFGDIGDEIVLAQFTQLSFSRLRRCTSWRAGKPRTTSADLQNLRIKTPLNLQTLQLYPIVSRLSIQAQGRVAASGSETLWALDMLEACKHPTKIEGINIRNHQPSPKRVRLGYEWITFGDIGDEIVLAQFTQLSFSRLRRCTSWRAGKPRTTSADLQNLRIKTPLNLQTLQLYPILSRLSIQAQGRVAASGSETLWTLDMLEACKHPTKIEGINIRNHQPSPKRVRLGYEWITFGDIGDEIVLAQFTQLSFSRLRRCTSWRAGKPRTTSADLQNLRIKTPLNLQTLQLYPILSRLSIQAQGRVAASGSETLWTLDMLEACKHPTKIEGINIRNHQPSPKKLGLEDIRLARTNTTPLSFSRLRRLRRHAPWLVEHSQCRSTKHMETKRWAHP